MSVLDDYIESVRIAYSKPAGNNWPARGRQLMSSYIKLAAQKQFAVLEKARERFSKKEVANAFWSATQIRYIITGEFVVGLKLCERDFKDPSLQKVAESTEYLLSLLQEKSSKDYLCLGGKNNLLTKEKVEEIINSDSLRSDSLQQAKMLSASLASFSWAFGYDTHFPNFMDIHGPYAVSSDKQLLVRDYNFENLNLVWEKTFDIPKRIRIYLLYKNSDISIDWELHTETLSEFILEKFKAVEMIRGEERELSLDEISKIIDVASEGTMKQVEYVNALPVLDKIRKGALLSFLQIKGLADLVGEDWKPSAEVEQAILQRGEDVWFGRTSSPKKPSSDNWLATFDPRIPKE